MHRAGFLSFPRGCRGRAQAQLGEFAPAGEGAAGNGASLAPATSNPRLACEDNGCLIFSIRRAQCRILSFTRGGASEVISQRHSARSLPLCGGARAPAPRGLAAGRGVQLRPLQRGPAARPAVGTGAASRGSRPPARPRGRCAPDPALLPTRSSRAGRGPAAPRTRRPLSLSITLPLSSGPRGLLSFQSRESEGTGRGGGGRSEGDGSLTQSSDLRGEEQMVPLTPAAERESGSQGPRLGALTPPARHPEN